MNSVIKGNYLVLLILLSFFIRLGIFAVVIAHPERAFTPDSGHYDHIAQNLVKFHRFLGPAVFSGGPTFSGLSFVHKSGVYAPGLIPESFRTPLYPAYLALIYKVFGRNIPMVIFFQIIMSLLISIMVYKISTTIFNQTVGIIAFILISLNLGLLAYPNYVLSETLFVFLITIAVWFLLNFLNTERKRDVFLSAFFLGLSVLCKPIALYLFSAFIPIFLGKYRKNLKKFFGYFFMYIGVFLLVISPWLARNYFVCGHAKLSSIQGYNLYFFRVAFLEAEKTGAYWETERKKLTSEFQKIIDEQQLNSMEASIISEKLAIQRILNEPFTYLCVHLKGMIKMFLAHNLKTLYSLVTDSPYQSGSALSVFFETGSIKKALSAFLNASSLIAIILICIVFARGVLYGFLLYGLYKATRTCPLFLTLLLLMIGYFVVVTGPLGSEPRFRIPIIPFITLLSSYGIFEFIKNWMTPRDSNVREKSTKDTENPLLMDLHNR